MDQGQRSFHSKVAYVDLLAVLIVSALIIVVWNSPTAAAVAAGLGLVWTALSLRSGIAVTDDGFRVRGLLRTRHLPWSETDAFIVVGFSGTNRSVLRSRVNYRAVANQAMSARVPLFSVVAVINNHGERMRVHGTASTPIEPAFPSRAAAELNRMLKRHNPHATAS